MAYVQSHRPADRIAVLAAVGALHVAALYAVVAGLTVAFTRADDPPPISATNTPVTPPPPPRPHPTHEAVRTAEPVIRDPQVLPSGSFTLEPFHPGTGGIGEGVVKPVIQEVRPTATPVSPIAARPLGLPGAWVGEADYPTGELRLGHAGTVRFRLAIGGDGRPTACTVTASSGYPRLDEATCTLIARRARFEPARDEQGQPMPGSFASAVRWQIPE